MRRSDRRTMASVEREEQDLITDMIRDAERTLEPAQEAREKRLTRARKVSLALELGADPETYA